MNGYRRLTQVDRIRIKDFLILGLSQTQLQIKQGIENVGPDKNLIHFCQIIKIVHYVFP